MRFAIGDRVRTEDGDEGIIVNIDYCDFNDPYLVDYEGVTAWYSETELEKLNDD